MKFKRNDYANIGILLGAFALFVTLLLLPGGRLYGSSVDWEAQHAVFPAYFRTLFYSTGQLLPDFAPHLGAGENIYNFAYYGLLNPVILLSYALPFVPMDVYIGASAILLAAASAVLFYRFLKNNGFSAHTALFASFLFLFAASMTLQSHRHVMFVNYMPFLILGLMGVDAFFRKGKYALLAFSVFMIAMTSFYFSVSALFALTVYGIYSYLTQKTDKLRLADFCKTGLRFAALISLGVVMASVLLLPSLHAIRERGADIAPVGLKELLLPRLNLQVLCYDGSGGAGMTAIAPLALAALFFMKGKAYKFLGAALGALLCFPLLPWALNGGLYSEGKAFIPFLPLFCLAAALFSRNLAQGEPPLMKRLIPLASAAVLWGLLQFNQLELLNVAQRPWLFWVIAFGCLADFAFTLWLVVRSQKKKNHRAMTVPLMALAFFVSLGMSEIDIVALKGGLIPGQTKAVQALVNDAETGPFQRFALLTQAEPERPPGMFSVLEKNAGAEAAAPLRSAVRREMLNRVFSADYYTAALYSSVSSRLYEQFCYDVMRIPIPCYERASLIPNSNPVFNSFMGNRWLVAEENALLPGCEKVKTAGGMALFRNNWALPAAYAAPAIFSRNAFDRQGYPYNLPLLLQGIVLENGGGDVPQSKIEKLEGLDIFGAADGSVRDGVLYLDVERSLAISADLGEACRDKVLFLSFRLQKAPEGIVPLEIAVNGMSNLLPFSSWKYHNGNYVFHYQTALGSDTRLDIQINPGQYEIADLEAYALDSGEIEDAGAALDAFRFDEGLTKGGVIAGEIDVSQDGWFTISVPYDESFDVFVDGEKTVYEKVNTAFIGFPIGQGSHSIKMVYHAPMKRLGTAMSALAIAAFSLLVLIEKMKVISPAGSKRNRIHNHF